jgi:hypothetical protein
MRTLRRTWGKISRIALLTGAVPVLGGCGDATDPDESYLRGALCNTSWTATTFASPPMAYLRGNTLEITGTGWIHYDWMATLVIQGVPAAVGTFQPGSATIGISRRTSGTYGYSFWYYQGDGASVSITSLGMGWVSGTFSVEKLTGTDTTCAGTGSTGEFRLRIAS